MYVSFSLVIDLKQKLSAANAHSVGFRLINRNDASLHGPVSLRVTW
jgi:hypothetical protein